MQIMNTSNCESSVIFSGGGPNSAGAVVMVGGTQLIPSPFVSLSTEKYKMGDMTIGGVLRLSLNGTVTGNSFNDVIQGAAGRTGLNDILQLGQNPDCVEVIIQCDNQLINGHGRIISVSSSEGNQPTWVNMAPYTIEIELYTNDIGLSSDRAIQSDQLVTSSNPNLNDLMLKNISETLSFSINDETYSWGNIECGLSSASGIIDGFGNKHIKLNFNISAMGIRGCPSATGAMSNYTFGLEAAESYLIARLKQLHSTNNDNILDFNNYNDAPNGGLVNTINSYFIPAKSYLDFRNISVNPIENSIEISGDIIYRPSGCLNSDVFTTLNVEQQLSVDGETITINGNIIGLAQNDYSSLIDLNSNDFNNCSFNDKMTHAETFLSKINNSNVLSEITNCYKSATGYIQDDCSSSGYYDDCATTVTVTPMPDIGLCDSMRITSSQITRNISSGEINFSFTLSNSANCDVLGAKKVNVEITHDKPHDNIVEIIIPGRGSKGPLIQNLCCNSAEKYDLTVDATLNRKTCTFNIQQQTVNELRACADRALQSLIDDQGVDVSCWFKTNDQESIGNTSYKLSRTYVKPSCP